VIVVVGRPALDVPSPGGAELPGGLAALIAQAAAAAGAQVELVGAVGDDAGADALAVALGRAGVGHAALLRVAGAATPHGSDPPGAWPRFDVRDLDLGLRYLPECRVLVLAEGLAPELRDVALDAAEYHGAAVVAVVADDTVPDGRLAAAGTVLVVPPEAVAPFADLVGRFAAGLDRGQTAGAAFGAATLEVGWEAAR
jgi:ribokinase